MRYPTLAAPSFLRPVAIFAGIISSVQATVNIVLSILGILVYECQLSVSSDSPPIQRCFVATYFQGPKCSPTTGRVSIDGMLAPDTVFAWVIAYLAIDVIWFIISSVVIYLAVKFVRKTVLPCLYVWTLFTLGVCCMDLAATIYFALQSQVLTFTQIGGNSQNKDAFQQLSKACGSGETLLSVPVIMMTMTARYYIFWLMNAALVTVIGVSALGISSRNSRDQDFFDDFSSQHYFGGEDSLNSGNNNSRRDVSVIDGWKEPWQSIPVVKIPKAKPMSNAANLYSVPNAHFSPAEMTPDYPGASLSPRAESYVEGDRVSQASSFAPPVPIPPPPPPPPSEAVRQRREGENPPRPKKHPPPPLDQKPLRPALKTRF